LQKKGNAGRLIFALRLIKDPLALSYNSSHWLASTVMLLPQVRSVHLIGIKLFTHRLFSAELAARYKEDGMLAYVELVQRKEKEIGCDVLTHQKWYVVVKNYSVKGTHVVL
jgi:hypothetical protein